jgi:hypothetical protein
MVAVCAFAAVSVAWADDSKKTPNMEAMTKLFAEAAQPTAEHEKLKPLAGNWTYTSKFWMDPNQPAMEGTGTIERKWILGDRFLEERVTGKGPDGKTDFEGRGVVGYDKAEKKYTSGWICSMGTGISTGVGTVDASGKKFTFDSEEFCPIRQKKVKARQELRIESNDKHVMEMYEIDDSGNQRKTMELIAVRQK